MFDSAPSAIESCKPRRTTLGESAAPDAGARSIAACPTAFARARISMFIVASGDTFALQIARRGSVAHSFDATLSRLIDIQIVQITTRTRAMCSGTDLDHTAKKERVKGK